MSAAPPHAAHNYVNGVCRCLGKCVTHNERGQVHVFPAENSDEPIDYFSDVDDYLEDQAEKRHIVAMANMANKQ